MLGIGEVMRHTDSQRHTSDSLAVESFMNDTDHSSRTLVVGSTQTQSAGELLIGGTSNDGRRTSVRYGLGSRSNGNYNFAVQFLCATDDAFSEGVPVHVRLNS